MASETAKYYGQRLGISSAAVIRQAEEYLRLLEVRSSSSGMAALGVSGSSRAVLCLDLAAGTSDVGIDKSCAMKLAGLNKKVYNSQLKAVERMLGLKPRTSLQEIAVQFGETGAKNLAAEILSRYEKEKLQGLSDYSQSLFNAAAFCAACRCRKMKVDKNKLVEVAGVKRSTFDALVTQMMKIAEKLVTAKPTVSGKKRSKTFIEELATLDDDETCSPTKAPKPESPGQKEDLEEYETWKKAILEEAYKALGKTMPNR